MKKIVVLLICLAVCMDQLTGCANNNDTFTQKNYTAENDQINEVNIDVRDRQIEVTLSADNLIHIDYSESSKDYYNIAVSDDNILTMTAANNKDWTDYIGGKATLNSRNIVLQLPDTQLTSLKLSTTNEDISLSAMTIAGNLSLTSNGGNIVFDKLNVEKAIDLNTKNANISGSVIGNQEDYSISCDIKKGKSNLSPNKNRGTKTLTVSNNNGDIAIKFIKE